MAATATTSPLSAASRTTGDKPWASGPSPHDPRDMAADSISAKNKLYSLTTGSSITTVDGTNVNSNTRKITVRAENGGERCLTVTTEKGSMTTANNTNAAVEAVSSSSRTTTLPNVYGSINTRTTSSSTNPNTKVYTNATLSTLAAHMKLASSTFSGPIINDANTAPFPCDYYTDEELTTVSLLQLYHRSCAVLGVKPNTVVERHLPNTCQYKPHMKIHVLDLSKTYLGPAGTAAIIPIISACKRLSHIYLRGVGMSHTVAFSLLERLTVHPSVREVDLSDNDLGTKIGEQLLKLVTLENKRIYNLGLENTLIIPALKKKIDAALAKNYFFRMEYAPDPMVLIAIEQRAIDVAREKQKLIEDEEMAEALRNTQKAEAERLAMAKRLKYEARQQLPVWFPVAAAELCGVLNRQKDVVNELLAVFSSKTTNGALTTARLNSGDSSSTSTARTTMGLVNLKNNNGDEGEGGPSSTSGGTPTTGNHRRNSATNDTANNNTILAEQVAVHLDALCERTPLRSFQRAMKIFNVTSLMDSTDRCALFVECFGAVYVDATMAEVVNEAQRKVMEAQMARATAAAAVEQAVGIMAEVKAARADVDTVPSDEAKKEEGDAAVGETPTAATDATGEDVAAPSDNKEDPTSNTTTAETDIIAATSSTNTGIVTATMGTAEGDKIIAFLPIDAQIEAQNLPVNQFYHHVPKPPPKKAAGGNSLAGSSTINSRPATAPTTSSSEGKTVITSPSADPISFTRYLAEDQKDLLLVNVAKIINVLRVHATDGVTNYGIVNTADSASANGATEGDAYGFLPTAGRPSVVVAGSTASAFEATASANNATTDASAVPPQAADDEQQQAPTVTSSSAAPLPTSPTSPKTTAAIKLRQKALSLQHWLFQMMADKLYDSRKEIYDCCSLLDADGIGKVYFHELCSGIGSVTMVPLFAQRREISRYMKMIRAIEEAAAADSASAVVACDDTDVAANGQDDAGKNKESVNWTAEGGNGPNSGSDEATKKAEGEEVSPTTIRKGSSTSVTAPTPSYPHDTDNDLTFMGAFVERYLRLVLYAAIAAAKDEAGSSSAEEARASTAGSRLSTLLTNNNNATTSTNNRTTYLGNTLANTDVTAINSFTLVPYRKLFATEQPTVCITEAAAAAHAAHRCSPNFWSHCTRKSLNILMSPAEVL